MSARILAVEDSPTQGALVLEDLTAAGFDVTLVSSGEQAVQCLAAKSFDLVLSDVVMPGIDGYEVCRRVKERDRDIPVVLLTSLTDPLEIVHGLEAGADNFLRKPYDAAQLVGRLHTMLYHREMRASGRASMGLEVLLRDKRFLITAERQQILDLLVSSFEDLVRSNTTLRDREEELTELSARLRAQLDETERERRRLGAVLASTPNPMVITDVAGTVTDASDALCAVLELPREEVVGSPVTALVSFVDASGHRLDDAERPVARVVATGEPVALGTGFDLFVEVPNGDRRAVIAQAAPVRSATGEVVAVVGTLHEIDTLAAHDPVTKMAHHTFFLDRLARAVSDAGTATRIAVTAVVVDRLDRLVRRVGEHRRDALVAAIADRLRGATVAEHDDRRLTGSVAAMSYFGDGVFAVAWSGLDDEIDAVQQAQRLHGALTSTTVSVEGDVVRLPVTVGVAVVRADENPIDAVASAVAAAREASAAGGDRVEIADQQVRARALSAQRRGEELARALTNGEIVVHYQPEVESAGGATVGVEALVRWAHPTEGLLPPSVLLPVADEAGLLDDIAWHVLDVACRDIARWRQSLPDAHRLSLSVNIDAVQLRNPELVGRVSGALAASGLDPSALVLEITERGMVDHAEQAVRRLEELKALGVRIAIDDFGTGFSSLQQLRRFPVDILKIDRSFVSRMTTDAEDAAIVAATIRLARALGLETVAEGVEIEEQLVQLRVLGCDLAQGFLWSPALAPDDLERWWHDARSGAAPSPAPAPAAAPDADIDVDAPAVVDELVAYLVHELRTPLTVLLGFASLLAESETANASYVDAVLRSARDLDRRLSSLADMRRAGHGAVSLELQELDLAKLARTVVDDVTDQLRPHPVAVDAPDAAMGRGDESRLRQALMNLLSNAAKFSEPSTPIEVAVRAADGWFEVSVRDHGPGVPPARRPELFRRFARLGSRHTGMGVGLYLVRTIARAHGGEVVYDDPPGGGARFTMRLPAGTAAIP